MTSLRLYWTKKIRVKHFNFVSNPLNSFAAHGVDWRLTTPPLWREVMCLHSKIFISPCLSFSFTLLSTSWRYKKKKKKCELLRKWACRGAIFTAIQSSRPRSLRNLAGKRSASVVWSCVKIDLRALNAAADLHDTGQSAPAAPECDERCTFGLKKKIVWARRWQRRSKLNRLAR